MVTKICACCGQPFTPRPQTPNQSYCSLSACQRRRRQNWLRNKLKTDPDYLDNQGRAQRAWIQRNPDYWRQYREKHPAYLELNRSKQKKRNQRQKAKNIAKMDESIQRLPTQSGVYVLSRLQGTEIAKIDAWIVELRFIAHLDDAPH